MGYRKTTIRRMYAKTKVLARAINELEKVQRVLKTQLKVMNDLEFSLAAYKRVEGSLQNEAPPEWGELKDEDQDQLSLALDSHGEDTFPGLDGPEDG